MSIQHRSRIISYGLILMWTIVSVLQCTSATEKGAEAPDKSESTGDTEGAAERKVNTAGESGCIVGDCNNGDGTYVWEDGSKYVGQWKEGQRSGNGTYLWASGDKYAGEFVNGDCEGNGVYTWKNGAHYEGQWKAGKMNGAGRFVWPSGSEYSGEFVDHSIKAASEEAAKDPGKEG
ncbi:MAG: hypothetical protein KDK39_09540 [Leptospiraceae bacterium]|nr:hypothetical protein [Leptospiraceae bacterium]